MARSAHGNGLEELVALIGRMTLEEKISLLSGSNSRETSAVCRLGIPSLKVIDARALTQDSGSVIDNHQALFPSLASLASTFNRDLSRQVGRNLGQEAVSRGANVVLGPFVGLREPSVCSLHIQHSETTPEHPLLSGTLAIEYVKGIQERKVAAIVQHRLAKPEHASLPNAEAEAARSIREDYLKPFEMVAKEADPWCAMPIDLIRGPSPDCNHSTTLADILTRQWEYEGMIVSSEAAGAVGDSRQGVNFAFPGISRSSSPQMVLAALREGRLNIADINSRVFSALKLLRKVTQFDKGRDTPETPDQAEYSAMVRQADRESLVLLRNHNDILPLQAQGTRKIALFGPSTNYATVFGSKSASPNFYVSPSATFTRRFGPHVEIVHCQGVPLPYATHSSPTSDFRVQQDLLSEAVALARSADVAIVLVDSQQMPDRDTPDTNLPASNMQNRLIAAIAAANSNTVVINTGGTPVEALWLGQVPATLHAGSVGQETGEAILDILTGLVSPSGKLPSSWPIASEQKGRTGSTNIELDSVASAEGTPVGFRPLESPPREESEAGFPFGYGLSYSRFRTSDVDYVGGLGRTVGVTVSVTARIKNIGDMAGQETVQVYVEPPADDGAASRTKRLAGFAKVDLARGQLKEVEIGFGREAAAYWDEKAGLWRVDEGRYGVLVATSSRAEDVKARMEISVPRGFTFRP